MAIDFGNTAFSGTITPSVPIVNPVQDKSGEVFASGISSALGNLTNGLAGLSDVFTQHDANVRAKAAAPINGSLFSDIAEKVNMLADAKDQGVMSTSEIFTRLRKDQNEFMANNPGQEVNIAEAYNKLLDASGLAPKLSEDTPEEKAKKAVLEEATKFGWSFDPKMSEDDAIQLYNQHQTDIQKVADIATKISLIQGDGQIVSASLKAQATTALHSVIASGMPWVQGKIDEGYKRLQGVSDPTARAAIIADVRGQITSQISVVDDLRTKSENSIDTSYMTAGFQSLLDNFVNVANGKETQDQYDVENKRQEAVVQHMINLDPETAAAFVLGKLTGYADPDILNFTTAGATKILSSLRNPDATKTPDVVNKDNDTSSAFGTLKNEFTNLLNDKAPTADTIKQANDTISGMLKSVAQHSHTNMDPTELNNFMQFMADPAVGKYLEQHMSELSPDDAKNAKDIIQQNYQNVGIDLVNERWGTAKTQFLGQVQYFENNSNTTDVNKAITPVWNGSSIEFQVAPEFKNNAIVNAQAKSLTADVAGPLNNMVRAQAHMEGTRDYTKVYNEEFAKRLWVANSPTNVPGDITDLTVKNNTATTDFLTKVRSQESSGNDNADSATSSASGRFGILDSTYKSYAKRLGLTGDKNNPDNQNAVMTAFTKDNQNTLEANDIPINDTNLYLAHFLGAQGAVDILGYSNGSDLKGVLSPKTIEANPFLKDWTVGDLKKWAKGVMNG